MKNFNATTLLFCGIALTASACLASPSAYATSLEDKITACSSAESGNCVINLEGAKYKITQTIKINPLRMTLQNGVIDASGIPDGQPAILVSSDGYSPDSYDTAGNSINHIVLTGQSNADGIMLNNEDDNYIRAAAITLENISVSGFRRGLVFGNHAYGFGVSHAQIHNNATGLYTIPHPVDAGERISFSDVGIFNNTVGIDDEGGMELDWTGSRWDYNGTTAIISGLFTFDGHIEISPPSSPTLSFKALEGQVAGALYMSAGSFVLVNQSGGQASSDYWATSTSPYNVVQFPVNTYGVKGHINVMQGPASVYGPSLPAFKPN